MPASQHTTMSPAGRTIDSSYFGLPPEEIVEAFAVFRGDLGVPDSRVQLVNAIWVVTMGPIRHLHRRQPGVVSGTSICAQECRDIGGTVVAHPCPTYLATERAELPAGVWED